MTLEGRTLPCGHCSPVQVQVIEFLVTTAHKNCTKPPHSLSMDFVTILSFGPRLPHLFSQSYASILVKNKWLVLIGTKGSFKTMIASHLLRHLSSKLFNTPEKYILFNMDSEGTQVSCVGGGKEGGRGEVAEREREILVSSFTTVCAATLSLCVTWLHTVSRSKRRNALLTPEFC